MNRIAIIAAMPGELKPLVRGWQQRGKNLWAGRIADCEAIAIAGGIGAPAAQRAVERVFAEASSTILVSYGWAGALTCAVKPPHAYAISEVVDATTGESFATNHTGGYRLITLDRVARADEKRALAGKHQAVLVDMEAAAVARMATARNVPFYCFKGVSDGYTDRLPDFNQFLDRDLGELRVSALVAHAAAHPRYWSSLWRLGKNSSAAAKAVAEMAEATLRQARSESESESHPLRDGAARRMGHPKLF